MPSTTAAGSTLAISANAPATQNEAGYDALTFTEVGGVEQLGPIGPSFNLVTFTPLKGPVEKHKGSVNYGALNPTIAVDPDDAGQVILKTAAYDKTSKLYSFEVTYATGEKRWFGARVMGWPENTGNADSILTVAPVIEISTEPVQSA